MDAVVGTREGSANCLSYSSNALREAATRQARRLSYPKLFSLRFFAGKPVDLKVLLSIMRSP
jgi:hypothetical protein